MVYILMTLGVLDIIFNIVLFIILLNRESFDFLKIRYSNSDRLFALGKKIKKDNK